MADSKKKNLHGNKAKIQPSKHVESLYQTNMATVPAKKDGAQAEEELQVEYARKFSEENKK